ncbi:MAG: glycosyltransferase family 9 protein [Bacteroidota bacterium]
MKPSSLISFFRKRIILSRTDGIGDVVLSLPLAGLLKKHFPDCEVIFLGKDYTKPIIECSQYVDSFISWDAISSLNKKEQILFIKNLNADVILHVFPQKEIAHLAQKAAIPLRVGTTNRVWHWKTCNYLVPLSRKNSNFHEAELNIQLLKSFIQSPLPIKEIIWQYYGFTKLAILSSEHSRLLSSTKPNIILHPFTKGSAREWGLDNFYALAKLLHNDFRIFITGSQTEGDLLSNHPMLGLEDVINVTGMFQLNEFIAFINQCDGLIAASTGPLHIAAALGKFTIGLYPPIRPMHPGRWAPLGDNATFLVEDKKCNACRKTPNCECIKSISPKEVAKNIINHFKNINHNTSI